MAKNSYKHLTVFFIPPRYEDHKNMKEKKYPTEAFRGQHYLGQKQAAQWAGLALLSRW